MLTWSVSFIAKEPLLPHILCTLIIDLWLWFVPRVTQRRILPFPWRQDPSQVDSPRGTAVQSVLPCQWRLELWCRAVWDMVTGRETIPRHYKWTGNGVYCRNAIIVGGRAHHGKICRRIRVIFMCSVYLVCSYAGKVIGSMGPYTQYSA